MNRQRAPIAKVGEIGPGAILAFHGLLAVVIAMGIVSAVFTVGRLPLCDFRALTLVVCSAILAFIYSIILSRLVIGMAPIREGDMADDAWSMFVYHVYQLFDLIVFTPVLCSRIVPPPLLRVVYLAMGARLGPNTNVVGIICDPFLVSTGSDCLLGYDSLLVPHMMVAGRRPSHLPIRIGNNVTVGARSIILGGVTI